MKELFVIDASSYLFRAYFAIHNMTNQEGQSTNALFGFISSLAKLIKDFQPTHIISVFDGPKSWQSRLDIYPEYKATRRAPPADLYEQIEWAKEFCKLFGISTLSIPEVEADDTIASVASYWEKKGAKIFICSEDKDLCQMVNDNVVLLYTRQENKVVGIKEVQEKFGILPTQIVDYLSIVGDASDNVPGIPGMGPKSAVDLLTTYGTLDNVLQHADDISGKKGDLLKTYGELALLSRRLVTVNTKIDFPHESHFFERHDLSLEELKEFLLHKQFHKFVKEFSTGTPVKEETSTHYHTVESIDDLKKLISLLKTKKEICLDTETTSEHPLQAEIVGIGLGFSPGEAWYIPFNGSLQKKEIITLLKPLFEDPAIGFYGHNIKYDLHILQNEGIELQNISFDTILASYVLNANMRQHNLDSLSLNYFGKVKISITDLIGKGTKQITMDAVPIEKVATYCDEDVDYTSRLFEIFKAEISSRSLSSLFYDIEIPLIKVLARMERQGIYLDVPYLQALGKKLKTRIHEIEEKIFKEVGVEFNLNSPKQLSEILFTKLGIKPPKKTATGFSTSAEVLEGLKNEFPIVEHILEYRTLEKLSSTYVEALPEQVNPRTHRIHCTFNQFVAATGRLSSVDPNLQNIPTRSELGKEIRRAFIPQNPHSSFLSADYSQIELRLLAHLSEDPALLEAFHAGKDIHRATAAKVFDVPEKEVTDEMRFHAKAVNFGILYGQGKYGLSQQLKISQKDAERFIQTYFAKYKKVKEFIHNSIEQAKKTEKAVTLTGRERPLAEMNSKNGMLRQAAERLAINTPLQGAAADLIKIAMLQIDELLNKRSWQGMMLLQIHDELLFEVPDHLLEEVKPLVKSAMEGVWKLKVPLVVDIAVGKNWAEC